MNKTEVLSKLEDFCGLQETIADKPFSEDRGLLIFGEKLVMSQEALSTASSWIGANPKFMEDCPVDLQATILNRLFKTEVTPKVIYKDDMVKAFVEQRAPILNPEKMISEIEKNFKIDVYDRLYPMKDGFELYLVGEKEHSVVVGDVVKGGAYVAFSPMGVFLPEVVSYVYRLACANGALRMENLMRYTYRGGGDVYNWMSDMTNLAYNSASIEVEKFKRMREVPLNGNTVSVLNHLLESVPKAYHDLIKDIVMHRHPQNIYELMNIITEIASHRVDNPRHIYNMMGASSNLSEDLHFCDNCHQVISYN